MLIFNLTQQPIEYRGRTIPPNGGSIDLPLTFVPDRDRKLEEAKKLSFGRLPGWWHLEQQMKTVLPPVAPAPRKTVRVADEPAVAEQVKPVFEKATKRFK